MTDNSVNRVHKRRRPRSIFVLFIFHLIQSAALAVYGVDLITKNGFPGLSSPLLPGSHLANLYISLTSGFWLIIYSLLVALGAFSLLSMRSWSWTALVAMQGLGLLLCLIGYGVRLPNYLLMFLGVILVFYLNQREVQSAYRAQ